MEHSAMLTLHLITSLAPYCLDYPFLRGRNAILVDYKLQVCFVAGFDLLIVLYPYKQIATVSEVLHKYRHVSALAAKCFRSGRL